ncbi:MAG: hypothetical protein JJT89_13740 [Nitriliruptoraceae bacterium]|nr:hypothetical protein [Nitriliruptoraceae bacterium]
MIGLWDLYLDARDAGVVLQAIATLERHRAVREPLPLDDVATLLERFVLVARIAEEEAVHWRREADDRRAEAMADGGRWGSAAQADEMTRVADTLAEGSVELALAAQAAAEDITVRHAERSEPFGTDTDAPEA